MAIKGLGKFPLSTSWCNSSVLRGSVNYFTRTNELEMIMDNYFFGTSSLKIWDGNGWTVSSSLKTYDGSIFIRKPLKIWNGSEWVGVNTN